MNSEKILIIDDETSIRSSLKGILEDEGFSVRTAETGEEGLELLKGQSFDLILLDIWLPEMNGIDVLKKVKAMEDNPQVVMISGHGTIESAVNSTKLGAFDFLEKPLSLEKVVLTVKNALKQRKLEEENLLLREKQKTMFYLVGKSRAIQKLRGEIDKSAPSNGRVLIYGENGTGKEFVARLIHQQSQRKDKKFLEINCSAVPDDLMESELFGYLKENQPHAVKDKKGKLLLADQGTLFLDEIGDMNLKTQAKLVRVIEEQRFEPLGSTESVSVSTRIIAATGKNLKELVARGKFREDLFFKLNVIPLSIPPLRERVEDIPLLINNFLTQFSEEYGKKPKAMNEEALGVFLSYVWPGNVSELMNVIERFVIMVPDDEINASHLSLLVETRELEDISDLMEIPQLREATARFERRYIHRILMRNKWDVPKTAADLGVADAELRGKIKSLNITLVE